MGSLTNSYQIGHKLPIYASFTSIALPAIAGMIFAGTAIFAPASAATDTSGLNNITADWINNEPRMQLSADKDIIIPTVKPDPALMIPLAPTDMLLPELRPDRRSLYPETALTLGAFYAERLGITPNQPAETFKLKSGEGLATLLNRGGMTATDAQNAISVVANHRSLRSLPVGFAVDIIPPIKIKDDESSEPSTTKALPGALRISLADDYDLTVYQSSNGDWLSQLSTRPIERYLTFAKGEIDSSLYKAGIKAGMSDNVFNTFVQVLSFSVDFQREIQKGDKFEALFETKRDLITGVTRKGTDLYYLSITLSGDRLDYFRHVHADGTIAWYDDAGNSASRTLMRTPVNGARLSSGYGKRIHPVLGYSKMHRGLDFAAPTGTPIMAAGSGVIEYSGRNGTYGKYIRIRHNSTYKTAYAHMNSIKRGITPGARVKQGQIIGTVGSTGRSTGPHLHYEILVNNRKTNPMTVRLPAGKSIEDHERERFEETLAAVDQELNSRGIIRFASD